ncbi:alpha/beta hydrolase family protein [Qipengyuania soli]|uniref:S9 family peptidase n=1 Tax=Qipengyuania soli TaxID=2782568 RepID=A0A7S8ITA6_9SPHN|nr:S9 family peptidase [Qipengyuania soli]QPC99903.1 S9 family peptidase [Qipengyuania soli]
MTFWKIASGACCTAIAFASQALQAGTAEETAAKFALRPVVLDVSLSPSGDKISYIAPQGDRGEILYVIDLAGTAQPVAVIANSEENTDLDECDWATDTHLVCSLYFIRQDGNLLLGYDRTMSVSAVDGAARLMSQQTNSRMLRVTQDGGSVVALDVPGEKNQILMTRDWVKERSIGTRASNDREGLGVDSIDVTTGKRQIKVHPDVDAERYIADQFGEVRLKMRHARDRSTGVYKEDRTYYYRPKGSSEWKMLSKETLQPGGGNTGFVPVAVDSELDIAYGFGSKNGYDAIYKVSLANPAVPELVSAKDGIEVDSLIRVGRQRRVVGVSFATERRNIDYFDPVFRKLSSGLAAALPGKPLVNIVDASADENKLLIIAASDVDPGTVYLLDRKTNQMEPLLDMRSHMDASAMAEMKPVNFTASDGTQIPGYLTLPKGSTGKGLKAIVLPHGGPSARDEWGFDWLVQFFAARGYAVLQPNFRGSAGYGEAWFGRNGFQDWKVAIGDVNDAGRWLVKQGIADPTKLAIVGWSYGGYAALQSQVLDPDLFKAVVAIAPVTDLAKMREHATYFTNSRLVRGFLGEGAHVREGSPAQNASVMKAPVLLFHGTLDQNVVVDQSRFMEKRLKEVGKAVTYVEFDGLDHQLEESKARFKMLSDIDKFLDTNLGG